MEGDTHTTWWSQGNKKDTKERGETEKRIYIFGGFCPSVALSPWGSLSRGCVSPGPLSPFQGPALPILGLLHRAPPLMSPVSQLFIFRAGLPPDKAAIAAEVCQHSNSHQ